MLLLTLFLVCTARAQKHTEFVGFPLSLAPSEMAQELRAKGLQQQGTNELSGRIAGIDVWVRIGANKDTVGCSHLVVTTKKQESAARRQELGMRSQDDYTTLMRWMQKHYGRPTWESTVRSHRFARWYVDYDKDIVMIATAQSTVEIWFYENHRVRHIDYYAILKYCERHPSDDVPFYTAEDCVTWKSTAPVVVAKKKVSKRRRAVRHRRAKARRRRR